MLAEKNEFKSKIVSSLEKVFADEEPKYLPECLQLTGLWGDTVSFQLAYKGSGWRRELLDLHLETDLAPCVRVRSVEQVPVMKPTNGIIDDNYLRCEPGLYPDLLRELPDGKVVSTALQWRSLWIDVELDRFVPAGRHEIAISLCRDGEEVCRHSVTVQVIPAQLPEQRIIHTEWIHSDCLVDYYGVAPYSEGHWVLLENCFAEMAKRGCNMMLVPMFTPALDTAVGLSRTTVQLVDVEVVDGEYRFDFAKLNRWIDLCQKHGIRYFEMSHLFSQWGAKHPVKVVAMVDGQERTIFSWESEPIGEYTRFLHALLAQLTAILDDRGLRDVTYFHISDEPGDHFEGYRAARESLGSLLDGFKTFDAISDYEIYSRGAIEGPIPPNNRLDEFLEAGVSDLWTYYCVGQFLEVSNRFMAMPSARNRIYGVQCYKYGIAGILHWGYNFYNTQLSTQHIDPYQVTDAGAAFPSGDAFLVYPGADGRPEESIRMMVHAQAIADIRAFELLESLAGREFVMDLIEGELAEPLTFKVYPKSDMYLIGLRNRVNREIGKRVTVS